MKYTLPHIPDSLLAIQPPETQKVLRKRGATKPPVEHRVFLDLTDREYPKVMILGLKLRSLANWSGKVRDKITYPARVRNAINAALEGVTLPAPPLTVVLVRHGPKRLDPTENAPMSFKHAIDAIAKLLGVDDSRDDLVRYEVRQEKGAYAVEIRFVRRAESGE